MTFIAGINTSYKTSVFKVNRAQVKSTNYEETWDTYNHTDTLNSHTIKLAGPQTAAVIRRLYTPSRQVSSFKRVTSYKQLLSPSLTYAISICHWFSSSQRVSKFLSVIIITVSAGRCRFALVKCASVKTEGVRPASLCFTFVFLIFFLMSS